MNVKVECKGYMAARLFKTVPDKNGKPKDVYVGSLRLELLAELLSDREELKLVVDEESRQRLGVLVRVGIIAPRVRPEKHS